MAAEYYDRKYRVGLEEAHRRIAIQDRATGLSGTVFPDPACDEYYQGIRGAENLLDVDVQFAPPGG